MLQWNKEAKRSKKPWITSAIRKSIKAKNSLLKAFLKNKDQFNYHRYKYYRDKLSHLIWDSKKQYYINFFNKNRQSALQISVSQWSIIANLWPLTVHIYHLMIIVTGGFFKKSFFLLILFLFLRNSFEWSWTCFLGI